MMKRITTAMALTAVMAAMAVVCSCSNDDIVSAGDDTSVSVAGSGSRATGGAAGRLRFNYLINSFGAGTPDGIETPHDTRAVTSDDMPHAALLSRYDTLGVTVTTADTTFANMRFALDSDGMLAYCDTMAEPAWNDVGRFSVKAYFPYSPTLSAAFSVDKDQSSDSLFRMSDFLYGEIQNCNIDNLPTLTLNHRVAWWDIDIDFSGQLTAQELAGASLAIYGVWRTATVDYDKGELASEKGNRGVVTFLHIPADNTATHFFGTLVIPQQKAGGSNAPVYLRLTFADGVKRWYQFDEKSFRRNWRYTSTIVINNYDQQFTTTIMPFDDGGDYDGGME